MHCISLWHDVRIERLEGRASRFEVGFADGGSAPWPLERDLAFRAHAAMERTAGRPLPVAVRVSKRIPAEAGLGGGSSDAAATLLALNELFALGMSAERLAEI